MTNPISSHPSSTNSAEFTTKSVEDLLKENFPSIKNLLDDNFKDLGCASEYMPQFELKSKNQSISSTGITSDNFLRTLSHLFMDSDIKGTDLEGNNTKSSVKNFIYLLKRTNLSSVKIKEIEKIFNLFTYFSEKLHSVSYTKKEIFKLFFQSLKTIIEKDKSVCLENYQLMPEKFTQRCESDFLKTISQDLISVSELAKNLESYKSKFFECLPEEFSSTKTVSTAKRRKESPQNTLNLKKFRSSLQLNFDSIWTEKHSQLILELESKIKNLKPKEELIIPTGFYSIPHGHISALSILNKGDNKYDVTVLNTGHGLNNHANFIGKFHVNEHKIISACDNLTHLTQKMQIRIISLIPKRLFD